ncbi:MAG: transcription antitermination factor NusB [bacterium]|nr:transcription antitermination factor NusB [bacterium]
MTNSRRKAREAVLQALYWSESSGDPVQQTLHTMSLRADLSAEAGAFAAALGKETWQRREALDQMIAGASRNWALERISRIDRILLRMALTEVMAFQDIPIRVSIDEAIELAKRYSVEKSPGFINGILDALIKQEGLLEAAGRNS